MHTVPTPGGEKDRGGDGRAKGKKREGGSVWNELGRKGKEGRMKWKGCGRKKIDETWNEEERTVKKGGGDEGERKGGTALERKMG